jgi:DNA-binding SARP family transcriptional activator
MGAEVRIFGSVRVTVDGTTLGAKDFGGRKPKQLLEILVLNSGRHVAKDRLAHLLWGDELPRHAQGSLEHYVSLLRRRLVPTGSRSSSIIVTDHGGYRFDADRAWVDLTEFDALYDAAIAVADRPALERALQLVTGELLEDEPYAEWALVARRDNAQRRLQLHVVTGELALAEGDSQAAVTHAEAALALDRLNEAAVRLLMSASYRAGEQTRALRAFEVFRKALVADVGADPMPETRAVHQAVLRQVEVAPVLDLDRPVLDPVLGPVAVLSSTGPVRLPGQRRGAPAGRPVAVERPAAVAVEPQDGVPPARELPAGRLVGRDAELAACLAVHARTTDGPGLRTVLVDGEMGVGRTALLAELGRRLDGQRVVHVTCTGHGSTVAGSLLEEVLEGLIEGVDVEGDAASPAELLDGVAGEGSPLTLAALRRLDLWLASGGPFAVLVDDAHLADDRSLLVLAALGRRRSACSGTVVLAADAARLPRGASLRRCPPDLQVSLEPLGRQHLLELGVPDLYEHTGGLPLLLAGCSPVESAGTGASPGVSAEVSARVLSRLQDDDRPSWQVVLACAMAGERFGAEEVARLSGLDVLVVAELQERLCRQRVLVAVAETYRFRYPLVRQVVRDVVTGGRRRLLQRRLRSEPGAGDRRRAASSPEGEERRDGADRRLTSRGGAPDGPVALGVALPLPG